MIGFQVSVPTPNEELNVIFKLDTSTEQISVKSITATFLWLVWQIIFLNIIWPRIAHTWRIYVRNSIPVPRPLLLTFVICREIKVAKQSACNAQKSALAASWRIWNSSVQCENCSGSIRNGIVRWMTSLRVGY